MARVSIVIVDEGDEGVRLEIASEPPFPSASGVDPSGVGLSLAQMVALTLVKVFKDGSEAYVLPPASIRVRPRGESGIDPAPPTTGA